MNLRNAIKRTITYSLVTVIANGEMTEYTVKGETTVKKELTKALKELQTDEIPVITVEVKTEERAMSFEDFISYSTVINENTEI